MSYTNDWKEEMLEQQQSYFISISGRGPIVATLTSRNSFEYYEEPETCCCYDDSSENVEVLAPCDYKELQRLELENEQLKKAICLARDAAYSSSQDCPKCSFIDELLTVALKKDEKL